MRKCAGLFKIQEFDDNVRILRGVQIWNSYLSACLQYTYSVRKTD